MENKRTRMAKKEEPKKESAAAVLARVTKEMGQPRFAKSAQKREAAMSGRS